MPFSLSSKKSFRIIIHLLVWILLFSMPYLLAEGVENEIKRHLRFVWLPLFYSAILFYLNYLVLADQFIFRKKIGLFILINLLLIIGLAFLNFRLKDSPFLEMPEPMFRGPHFPGQQAPAMQNIRFRMFPSMRWMIYRENIYLIFPVIIGLALRITEKWANADAARREAEKEKLNSELVHLRYQLQPHFFFNSLNNIYSLIAISPEKAQEAVHSLGKLMRYLLYEADTQKVELSSEVEFMRKYIELMRLRTTDKTTIRVIFPEINTSYRLAPLLFISLIENAFKHGVSATEPSSIDFELQIADDYICFIAENHNFPKSTMDKSGSGIGLVNLRKRLELLYPNNYSFETEIREQRYHARLLIYFREKAS